MLGDIPLALGLRSLFHEIEKAEKVVIGGGPVGFELAGEIFDRYEQEKKVTVVSSRQNSYIHIYVQCTLYKENTYIVCLVAYSLTIESQLLHGEI